MGKIITVANHKGGVGKTTVAINLADALKHCDMFKVLLIDLDSQHNATDTFGAKIEDENTMVDVLKGYCTIEEAIQRMPMGDIVPGDDLLASIQKELIRNLNDNELAYVLKNALNKVKDTYDYIIIDTSPALDIYMEAALNAADECIIPITAQKYAIDGLANLMNTINYQKENYNKNLELLGVLLNVYDRRLKMDRDVKDMLPEYGKMLNFNVLDTHIRISQEIKNAQAIADTVDEKGNKIVSNRSLFDNYPGSAAVQNYINLVREIVLERRVV